MKISKNVFGLVILTLLYGCNSNKERDFFRLMKTSYPDIEIDSSFYYIKSFGLSKSSQKIGDNLYWELHSDRDSEFFLPGYLRKLNDSIMIAPHDYYDSKKGVKEYKLFDFSAHPQQSWNVLLGTEDSALWGDSVVFQRTEKINQEQIYIYVLNPYMFSPNGSKYIMGESFEVGVSKEKGIISVKSLIQGVHQWGTDQVDTVYKLVLYPKVLFTNNKGNTLDL